MKKILSFLLLGLLLSIGYAWGEDQTYTIGFEADTYTDWALTTIKPKQTNSNVSAREGSYFGNTDGKTTGSIITTSKIASPKSIVFYVSKQSTNTTASSWLVKVSSDGSTWTQVGSAQSASSGITRGTWTEVSRDLSSFSNVYVGIFYDGTTAVRCIDDVTLTYTTGGGTPQPTTYSVTYNANGATSGSVPEDDNEYDEDDEVTVLGNTGSLAKTGYIFAGWNENAAGTGADISGTFTITQDTTLYAKWTAKTITGLSYTGTPTKTSYYAGENFASAGLTVTATFNDESQEDVTASVDWTPKPLTKGTTSVTGTYMGQTVNIPGLTVTAAPGSEENPFTTMDQIFAASETAGTYYVTLNNWVVSGASTSNAYVTDNNGKGFIVYNKNGHGFDEGDILSGTIQANLTRYGGAAEFTSLTSSTTGLTIATDGTVSPASVAMADLTGVNTGALLSYTNLTCSISSGKYYLTDGTTTLQLYNALYDFAALENSKNYNIQGVYVQYNSTKEILPRSADDIVKVVVSTPSIDLDKTSINAEAAGANGTIAITYENLTINDANDFGVAFYDANQNELATAAEPDWVEVDIEEATAPAEGYVVSYVIGENDGAARTAYMKVYALADDDYVYSELITISQKKAVVIEDGVFDFSYDDEIDYGTGLEPATTDIKEAKTFTAGNITVTPEPTANNKYWRWYTGGTLRLYTDTKMTIAAPTGYIITKIEFEGTQNLDAVTISAGNYVSSDKKSATWTGFAQSIVFTRNGSNPFFTKITVTYGTSATLTLGTNGWSTFAAPFAYTVSDATVYTAAVSTTDANYVILSSVAADAVIPANAGIILKGEGTTATITASAEEAATLTNSLVGVVAEINPFAVANAYILATNVDGDGETKFHLYTGTTFPAHKAYLPVDNGSNAPIRIEFAENNTTDINAVEASEKAVKFFENGKIFILRDGVVYDATGRVVR